MFRRTYLALTAAALMAGPAFADNHGKDIVDIAAGNESFSTLVAAVQAADLVDTLKGEGPFTVFAPTDDAFAALPAGTVEDLLKPENKDKLTAILTYHVVPGKVMSGDLSDGMTATTVQGSDVTIGTTDGVTVDGAKVVQADIEASNGVIHVIALNRNHTRPGLDPGPRPGCVETPARRPGQCDPDQTKPALDMLRAVDLDLGAGNIGRPFGAEEKDRVGHLIGFAQPPHRDALDQLVRARRQDCGADLSGGNGIDPHAQGAEIMRHFARQRHQRRLGCGIGRAGKGMHAASGNRGDIHHRPFGRRQFIPQTARQHHRGKEIDVKHLAPSPQIGGKGIQPFAIWPFGGNPRVIDQRVQPPAQTRA